MTNILEKINKQFEWGFIKNKSHHFVGVNEHSIHKMPVAFYAVENFKLCNISEDELIELIKLSDLNWCNSAGTTILINLLFKITKKKIVFSASQEQDILNYVIHNSNLKHKDFSNMQSIHLYIDLCKQHFFNIERDTLDYWVKNSDINLKYDSTENLLNYYLLNIITKKTQLSNESIEWLINNTDFSTTHITTFLYNILFKKDFYPLTDSQLYSILSKGDINQTVAIDLDNRNLLFIYFENISSNIYKHYISENHLDLLLKHTNLNHKSHQNITLLELIFAIELSPNVPNTNITSNQLKYIIEHTTTKIQLNDQALEVLTKKITTNNKTEN